MLSQIKPFENTDKYKVGKISKYGMELYGIFLNGSIISTFNSYYGAVNKMNSLVIEAVRESERRAKEKVEKELRAKKMVPSKTPQWAID